MDGIPLSQALFQLVQSEKIHDINVIGGPEAEPLAHDLKSCQPSKIAISYQTLDAQPKQASLVVGMHLVGTTPTGDDRVRLGHLKNLIADRIFLCLPITHQWPLTDLFALGFFKGPDVAWDNNTFLTYTYNLATYNHKREWNSPRFWANPQNWNKYRW